MPGLSVCIPTIFHGAKAAVEAAMAEKKEYRYEYRVVWPDGTHSLGSSARRADLRRGR